MSCDVYLFSRFLIAAEHMSTLSIAVGRFEPARRFGGSVRTGDLFEIFDPPEAAGTPKHQGAIQDVLFLRFPTRRRQPEHRSTKVLSSIISHI